MCIGHLRVQPIMIGFKGTAKTYHPFWAEFSETMHPAHISQSFISMWPVLSGNSAQPGVREGCARKSQNADWAQKLPLAASLVSLEVPSQSIRTHWAWKRLQSLVKAILRRAYPASVSPCPNLLSSFKEAFRQGCSGLEGSFARRYWKRDF